MFRRDWIKGITWSGLSLCGCGLGCRSAPITGRKQLLLLPENQEIAMGQESFTQILGEEPLSANARADDIARAMTRAKLRVFGRDSVKPQKVVRNLPNGHQRIRPTLAAPLI